MYLRTKKWSAKDLFDNVYVIFFSEFLYKKHML